MSAWTWPLLLWCGGALAQATDVAPYQPAALQALITDADLDEISGIAPSRRRDHVYWVHNDAPRPARLDAIDEHGRRLGGLRIAGVRAVDWEDIASYELDGKSWLLIGDIGDNNARRTSYELVAVEEPILSASAPTPVIEPAWRLRFRYPDGAHDVEAMAVDLSSRQILLVTKHAPPTVYTLPLRAGGPTTIVARRQFTMDFIPKPKGNALLARFPAARFGASPTGFDIESGGRRAALLTYRDVWLFDRRDGESWLQALRHHPAHLTLPPMPQAEAIGFDRSGGAIMVGGERLPAPLLRFESSGSPHAGH